MYEDDELKALLDEEADLLDMLITQHFSLDSAKVHASQEHGRFKALSRRIQTLKEKLRIRQYRDEYQRYIDRPCDTSRPKGDEERTLFPTATPLAQEVNSAETGCDSDEFAKLFSNIDPTLLDDDPMQNMQDFLTKTDGAVDDVDLTGEEIDPTLLDDDPMQNMQDFLTKTDGAVDDVNPTKEETFLGNSIRVHQFGSSKTLISPWTIGVGVVAAMFGSRSQTEIELGDSMVNCFDRLHPIDHFYPGQEPLPGTLLCRFCQNPMVLSTAAEHARSRAKAAVLKTAQSLSSTQLPILQQCSWTSRTGGLCNKGPFASHAKHIYDHIVRQRQWRQHLPAFAM